VGWATDRFSNDDGVVNSAVGVNAEMTEHVVEHLLLHTTSHTHIVTTHTATTHTATTCQAVSPIIPQSPVYMLCSNGGQSNEPDGVSGSQRPL